IYPAVDFAYDTASHRELADGHVIPRDRILWYAEEYLRGEADRTDPCASPVRTADLTGQPPALVITAGFDPLREEGRVYADRLREAGVDVVYHEYPGQIHAFISLTKVIPQGMECTREVAAYLRRRLVDSCSRRSMPPHNGPSLAPSHSRSSSAWLLAWGLLGTLAARRRSAP